jgi:glycosyltransferase involved in cell wall biosynthesis
VTTNCKAVLEVGGNALTVAYEDDPRILADAILKTMSSDRNELIQKGMAVAQGYSWENTHRQTLGVYQSLGA